MLRNGLEPWHVIVLLAVILLVFGGKKLPELARGSGRALRIFKAETKGVFTDDDAAKGSASNNVGQLDSGTSASAAQPGTPASPAQAPAPAEPDAVVRHDAGTD